jgi:fimbrial chaperone protein
MLLTPTRDIVVFPTMLTLKPGETRNVRVGALLVAGSSERSYRVFVEELPPLPGARRSAGIQVLMRMGIPVFVGGEAEAPALRVETASFLRGGRFSFVLRNRGGAHTVTRGVEASLLDARGEVVTVRAFPGWYLLAGGERVYEGLADDATACAATLLRLRVDTDGGTITSSAPIAGAACGR